MSGKLIAAIVTITCALICYTIGVWSEHRERKLKVMHLVFFWLGLCFDTTGTTIMTSISKDAGSISLFSPHGITGALAIGLMIIHAVWATVVLVRKDERAQTAFHRFSLIVWCVWLIPFVLGMIIGMQ
ncbi:MAG: HsmA family protein [Lachnospiraceae bacterium]|jgi:uncharacterized repeat protein (TIGR03987 family)|nr:HsmA family protein [Lachnospiraceae bacterium]MDD3615576.1 HsmA family protein [Lachnospiraceae bacterium]